MTNRCVRPWSELRSPTFVPRRDSGWQADPSEQTETARE